jgi:YVTN family beta-propeller protein
VACTDDHTVDVIETQSNTVSHSLTVGQYPHELCVVPGMDQLYNVNHGDHSVTVTDLAQNAVIDTIPVDHEPFGICALPSGEYVYVALKYLQDNLLVIRTSDRSVMATLSVGTYAQAITCTPDGEYVLVPSQGDGRVLVLE